jgi:hypothetical protein
MKSEKIYYFLYSILPLATNQTGNHKWKELNFYKTLLFGQKKYTTFTHAQK